MGFITCRLSGPKSCLSLYVAVLRNAFNVENPTRGGITYTDGAYEIINGILSYASMLA